MPVNILFIGDVIGRPGREALSRHLHRLVDKHSADLVVVNGENSAGGFGMTRESTRELFDEGVDVITAGNHIWDKKEVLEFISDPRIVRPANYPPGTPGHGSSVVKTSAGVKVGILNLEGQVFMSNIDSPFRVADAEIEAVRRETPIIIVDFHAEATSEKQALGWYLDGRVSAVIGTHTHVQTADERILPGGTAFLSDAGMTGGHDSVIGMKKEEVLRRFLTQMPARFEVSKKDVWIHGAAVSVDDSTGRALGIERIRISLG